MTFHKSHNVWLKCINNGKMVSSSLSPIRNLIQTFERRQLTGQLAGIFNDVNRKDCMTDEIERLRKMYATQYNPDPQDRNYIWNPLNPVSIYYRQAQERAIADLFRRNYPSLSKLNVLDIGCGSGGLLRFLASLGIPPNQLSGIDLMKNRIKAARQLAPPGMTLFSR